MSGPNTFSRVTISGIMVAEPRPYTGEDGKISHVSLEVGVGDQMSRMYCTAFNGTAVQLAAAGLQAGDHVLLNGRLRPSKLGDRSNWVEVQEIALGVRDLEEGDG